MFSKYFFYFTACFFAREILIEEGLFFVLGLFSAIVLSDLLLTWTILLSFALGIVFLVAGVVYIPFHQSLLLLFSFPLLIAILIQVRDHLFKEHAKIKDQETEADVDYCNRFESFEDRNNTKIQALLIHWSHEELFFQLQPEEYSQMLNQIHDLLSQYVKHDESLYYVSDGNYLFLSSDSQRDLKNEYDSVIKNQLENLVFCGEDGEQSVQFQSGFVVVDQTNKTKYGDYKDLISHLKRQLETDIIVEY